jgi:ATPase family AAA domain-containing protein 3A/B
MALFARAVIESMIGKPKLIRETTKKGFFTGLLLWFWERLTQKKMSGDETHQWCVDKFSDVVLVGELKERVLGLALSARKAKDYDAPHRHVLLYGPPGTGKTMVAKKMAECVGMDYALMSGGDVGPLGADGVTQIHNLFRWAKMSKKGVLLFIDEAEAFLASRGKKNMSEVRICEM